jgi:hypothetical protein
LHKICGAEGIDVISLSDFTGWCFGKNNGLEIVDGPLSGFFKSFWYCWIVMVPFYTQSKLEK